MRMYVHMYIHILTCMYIHRRYIGLCIERSCNVSATGHPHPYRMWQLVVNAYKYIRVNIYMFVYIHIYVCVCICIHIYVYICIYIYVYIYMYIYIYTYIQIYTYMCVRMCINIERTCNTSATGHPHPCHMQVQLGFRRVGLVSSWPMGWWRWKTRWRWWERVWWVGVGLCRGGVGVRVAHVWEGVCVCVCEWGSERERERTRERKREN